MYAINQKKIQSEIINNMFKKNKGDYTRVDKDNSIFTYVLYGFICAGYYFVC